jgi:glutamate 5-kinase
MSVCELIDTSELIVIKIGTALVVRPHDAAVKAEWLAALAQDVQSLISAGKRIVIVSSGAVALGRTAMGIALTTRPSAIPLEVKQAASAVGQYHLFHAYQQAFQQVEIPLAQVLLTMSETENRRMHLNARATLWALLDKGIIPVINENDTISTGEIRFGDNDRLAARVAQMIEADMVVLLSTISGLYASNPDIDPQAPHIPLVETLSAEHLAMAGEAVPGLSTGGMKSKIEAAQSATLSGISLVIAKGAENHALGALVRDETTLSTLFLAKKSAKNARKRWIGSHLKPKGRIFIDRGAVLALQGGKSLLPVGVKRVEGVFERGDVVEIYGDNHLDKDGQRLGMGIIAYGVHDALKITGQASDKIAAIIGYEGRSELIHRNDLVLG